MAGEQPLAFNEPERITIDCSSSCRATNRPPIDHFMRPLVVDSRTPSSARAACDTSSSFIAQGYGLSGRTRP